MPLISGAQPPQHLFGAQRDSCRDRLLAQVIAAHTPLAGALGCAGRGTQGHTGCVFVRCLTCVKSQSGTYRNVQCKCSCDMCDCSEHYAQRALWGSASVTVSVYV